MLTRGVIISANSPKYVIFDGEIAYSFWYHTFGSLVPTSSDPLASLSSFPIPIWSPVARLTWWVQGFRTGHPSVIPIPRIGIHHGVGYDIHRHAVTDASRLSRMSLYGIAKEHTGVNLCFRKMYNFMMTSFSHSSIPLLSCCDTMTSTIDPTKIGKPAGRRRHARTLTVQRNNNRSRYLSQASPNLPKLDQVSPLKNIWSPWPFKLFIKLDQ